MGFINADVGESFHHWNMGQDQALMPWIDAVNIATGFHAGDPLTLETTLQLAQQHQLMIAAHPGYADLIGFGRRSLPFEPKRIAAELRYQLGAFKACASFVGVEVSYIKPHGALYHDILHNPALFRILAEVVQSLFGRLPIMVAALPATECHALDALALDLQQPLLKEAFLDRHYQADGRLVPRTQSHALVTDSDTVIQRWQAYQATQNLITHCGESINMQVDSWCLHGDQPQAVAFAQALHPHIHPVE